MLNESKGNMYSWITHTWNTVKGECPHGCTYCYMKRWGQQKPLHFDEKELNTNLGTGNFIFIGSSCDLFANNIPQNWIFDTISHCYEFKNSYLFQSKNPSGFIDFYDYFPDNLRVCTTIESNRFYPEIMMDSPEPIDRVIPMNIMSQRVLTYVTIEPIMDFDLDVMVQMIHDCHPTQVNIGADSGGHDLPEPPKAKLLALIEELKKFTVIDQKRNLSRLLV